MEEEIKLRFRIEKYVDRKTLNAHLGISFQILNVNCNCFLK